METIAKLYEQIQPILYSEQYNEDEAIKRIQQLKELMLPFPIFTKDQNSLSPDQHVLFRKILEADAIISIRSRRLPQFENAINQLKCIYFSDLNLPPSEDMPLLMSIHLVYLLSINKLVDFNLEFQLVHRLVPNNEYVEYAAELHKSVSDNSFSKLFTLENMPPSPLFSHFTTDLLAGARNNHADSIERAYTNLTIIELASILHFNTLAEAQAFIEFRHWNVDSNGLVVFNKKEDTSKQENDMVDRAVDLAVQISSFT